VDLILGEPHDLRGGHRRAKDAEHRTGVEAARHHRRNPVGGHPLHDLVAGREAGDEIPSGSAFGLRRDERRRDDRGAWVREHAERIPLSAGQHHFGVGKGGTASGHPGPLHHDGGAAPDAGLFVGHEFHRLLAGRQLRSEERGGDVLERQSLGAIDDRWWKILMTQAGDPLRELPAERRSGRTSALGRRRLASEGDRCRSSGDPGEAPGGNCGISKKAPAVKLRPGFFRAPAGRPGPIAEPCERCARHVCCVHIWVSTRWSAN
jgi:hypothetical protein